VTSTAEPAWLKARRAEAAERFADASLPTTSEEVWRYSRIAELDLDAYRPATPDTTSAPGTVPEGTGERAALVVVHNGRPSRIVVVRNGHVVSVQVNVEGLQVGRLTELDPEGTSLAAVAGDAIDKLDLLHDAHAADPVLVRVPRGMVVTDPVVVVHWIDAPDSASFPHLVVQAGEDSEVTVYDHYASAPGITALVVPTVELDVGDAARVKYLNAQLLGDQVWQLGYQASRVGRDANLVTNMVALGGDYARLRIDSKMVGKGGSGEMLAVYFGEGHQMHDFRTLQDHIAPKTTSELLFKGAVEDSARSVYTGLIHIGKQAAGVNAFQTNRNIKLSADAWAESVPNLEIENNDVRCSHASAVGPVDEEQLFYLESRGVPPDVAERLIVIGFFEDVLERLPVPGAAPALREEIAAKLSRRRG
jgi:Fe-S cluster assembly protein SufD